MSIMFSKKPLEPLIPLDDLKQVVAKLITVPKGEIEKAETKRLKRKRAKKD